MAVSSRQRHDNMAPPATMHARGALTTRCNNEQTEPVRFFDTLAVPGLDRVDRRLLPKFQRETPGRRRQGCQRQRRPQRGWDGWSGDGLGRVGGRHGRRARNGGDGRQWWNGRRILDRRWRSRRCFHRGRPSHHLCTHRKSLRRHVRGHQRPEVWLRPHPVQRGGLSHGGGRRDVGLPGGAMCRGGVRRRHEKLRRIVRLDHRSFLRLWRHDL